MNAIKDTLQLLKQKILIVEDDPEWQEKLQKILEQEPLLLEADAAYNSQQAKEFLSNDKYMLILLDLCLEGDSPTVSDQLFWEDLKNKYPNLPVFGMTGWPIGTDKVFELAKSEKMPFSEFFDKGHLDLNRFRRRILQILQKVNALPNTQKFKKELVEITCEVDPLDLREILERHFDEIELNELCFDMDIIYSELAGSNKTSKIIELLLYCRRRNKLKELEHEVKLKRPFLS